MKLGVSTEETRGAEQDFSALALESQGKSAGEVDNTEQM